MTPNPVCYNRLSQSPAAIHIGTVSLGLTPKDYRADTARKWRAGISPNTNIVLYSDTFSRGIDTEDNAVPRIWWIDGTGTYTDKIAELVSRLPDRSANNYALMSYTETLAWLKASGKYALINCDYPEYTFAESLTGCQTVANIESGYLGSYYGGGDTEMFNLANPTTSVGFGTHAPAAFKVKDFNLISATGVTPNGNGLGSEGGFVLGGAGGLVQTTATAASVYSNGFVFEGVFGELVPDKTLFELYDTVANKAIYQVRTADSGIQVLNISGSICYQVDYDLALTQPSTYITFAHKAGETPIIRANGGESRNLSVITPITWTNTTKWVVGSHLNAGTYSEQVQTVKSFKIHLANDSAAGHRDLQQLLHSANYPIVSSLYTV
jgi:hypothetical protein